MSPEEYAKLKDTPLTPDEVRNAWASGVSADKMDTFMSRVLATAGAIDELRAQIEDVRDRLNEFNDASKPPAHGVAAMWQRVFELSYPKRGREP